MRLPVFLPLLLLLWSCNLSLDGNRQTSEDRHDGKARKRTYSYACVDSSVANRPMNRTIGKAGDLLRDLAISDKEVTDEMQSEYGAMFHQDAIETKTFVLWNDATAKQQLEKTMHDLLAVRENPSRISYYIYALDDTAINAFTFGGRIYVTKAMYDRCKGRPALLYAIVGHEIGHSERGHIKNTIKEMRLAQDLFGEKNGTTVFQLKKLVTASFNQHNELEADYYGTDLSYELNQDLCAAVTFWKEMARQENQYSTLEDFFRTHPFSALRARCLQDHIRSNFGAACTESQ